MLSECDLTGYENFNKNVKSHIEMILLSVKEKDLDTDKPKRRKRDTKLVKYNK